VSAPQYRLETRKRQWNADRRGEAEFEQAAEGVGL